jgi:plastocyanin
MITVYKTTRALGSMLAMASFASAAHGETQQVDIIGESFFPPVIIVNPGDTIVFFNRAAETGSVISDDETWTTEQLAVGDSYEMVIAADTQPAFYYSDNINMTAYIAIVQEEVVEEAVSE